MKTQKYAATYTDTHIHKQTQTYTYTISQKFSMVINFQGYLIHEIASQQK